VQLLVSVESAVEAMDALAGGADVIDAKDPRTGALGRVAPRVLAEIAAAVAGSGRPLSAALGDACDETAIEDSARVCASAGAAFVKVGFAGIASAARIDALIAAALRGARRGDGLPSSVIAVAYADADRTSSLDRDTLVDVAARGGAAGVLLDTADKRGPALRELMTPRALKSWVGAAHRAGLLVAVAGKLSADDLTLAYDAGADIAGVRTAACAGGRTGRVAADHVRVLRMRVAHHASSAARSASIRSAATISTATRSEIA
jgi:(5-formylfuran-3-yl)methyl phosphate synthase